jgi:hypothetical protein
MVYENRRLHSKSGLADWVFAFTRLLTATDAESRPAPFFGFPDRGCFGNKLGPVFVLPLSSLFLPSHQRLAYHRDCLNQAITRFEAQSGILSVMAILQQLAVPLDGMVFAFVIFELAHSRFSKHSLERDFHKCPPCFAAPVTLRTSGLQSTK